MTTEDTRELERRIAAAEHPRELAVDVMFALQEQHGYLSDEALVAAAQMLGMSPLEVEQLATFYPFVFREPVGRYVIHVCDSVICWLDGHQRLLDHLTQRLGIDPGQTTPDGLFTLLPVCCIGYCDRSPAMLINRKVYGHLTVEKIDDILRRLRDEAAGRKGEAS